MHLKSNTEKSSFTGLFGVAFFSICWLCAVVSDPSWTLGENMVSDLGVSDTNAAYFFNYGCIITGIILCAYGIMSAYYGNGTFEKISYVLIDAAGAALIGVGTFTEDTGCIHNISAYTVFILAALSAVIRMVLGFIRKRMISAVITAALIICTAVVAFVETFPFLEAFAIIILLIWIAVTCIDALVEFSDDKYTALEA